ncbi:MAG: TatD family hydrolase [Clostridiales Family XIII bacterium]|jgi:TatD DNase family protein|nr:TatD family hydrolase [Clostridiales Family XIII bacterium]
MTNEKNARNPVYAYFDAHTHLREETPDFFAMLAANKMAVAASVSRPFTLPETLAEHLGAGRIFLTAGIHPWDAADADVHSLERVIKGAKGTDDAPPDAIGSHPTADLAYGALGEHRSAIRAVGEIGMDSVWCDVPPDVQRKCFLRQLDLAEETGLPVVLHTKGCEEEIAALIQPYSGPFLVHWYSAPTLFPGYSEKDCFFTVGPDVAVNAAVQNIARAIPADRLMTETDGREAVAWATGRRVTAEQLPAVLDGVTECIADLQNLPVQDVRRLAVQNACAFYHITVADADANP